LLFLAFGFTPALLSFRLIAMRVVARAVLPWVSITAALSACARPEPSSTPLAAPRPVETDAPPGVGATKPSPSPHSSAQATEQRTAADSSLESPVPVLGDDATWGSADAPVTIVAFVDFQCPFSARAQAEELKQKYGPNRLRLVFKHYPLVKAHPHALQAARVARAVLERGGPRAFWSFVALMYERQDQFDDELPLRIAEKVGLSRGNLKTLSEEAHVEARIAQDIALARELTVAGTPSFRINGIKMSGARPLEDFTKRIDDELEAAGELLDRGALPKDIYALRCRENVARSSHERIIKVGKPSPKPTD
jgi:protein-disulfide isomerase